MAGKHCADWLMQLAMEESCKSRRVDAVNAVDRRERYAASGQQRLNPCGIDHSEGAAHHNAFSLETSMHIRTQSPYQ